MEDIKNLSQLAQSLARKVQQVEATIAAQEAYCKEKYGEEAFEYISQYFTVVQKREELSARLTDVIENINTRWYR